MSAKPLKSGVLIVERGTIVPLELSVDRHQRAFALDVHAKIRRYMEIGAQPEPRQEICIGLLGLRSAPLELIEVLHTRTGLPTEAQPHALIPVLRE